MNKLLIHKTHVLYSFSRKSFDQLVYNNSFWLSRDQYHDFIWYIKIAILVLTGPVWTGKTPIV